jgi:hypothetical protein
MISSNIRTMAAEFLVDSIEYLRAGGVTSEIMATLNSVDVSEEDGSDFIDYFLIDLMGSASAYVKAEFPPDGNSDQLELLLSATTFLIKDISGLNIGDIRLMIDAYRYKTPTPREFDRVSTSFIIHILLAPTGRRKLTDQRERIAEAYLKEQSGRSGSAT